MKIFRRSVVTLLLGAMGLLHSVNVTGQATIEAARLGPEFAHRIVAHTNDDGTLEVLCIQGDEHTALQALSLIQSDVENARVGKPAAGQSVATVGATLRVDNSRLAGADAEDRLLLYTPSSLMPGSTFSHFDTSASPNLLMEPAISADLRPGNVDLTDDLLRDLGWRNGTFDFEIRITDAPGEGFNDPVLGAQRVAALQHALRRWGKRLGSAAPLVVDASFANLFCAGGGAALAGAAPRFVFRGAEGMRPDTWYMGPMAESIARADLTGPNEADMLVIFNSAIDDGCLGAGTGWYYGTDAAPAGTISFVTTSLHEIGHGLGFTGTTDLDSGRLLFGYPDILTTRAFDNDRGEYWHEMSRRQRARSAQNSGRVAVDARRVRKGGQKRLDGSPVIDFDAPASLAGSHLVGTATFGPALRRSGLSGDIAEAVDGVDAANDACEPLTNGAEVAGKLALINRGTCSFAEKVANAQAAGAIGVVIANNVRVGISNMGGDDDSIEIPSVMVTRELGREIRRELRK